MVDRWESGPCFGIVTDTPTYDLAPGLWSYAYNVSFKNNRTSARTGLVETLYTYSTTTMDATPNNTGNGAVASVSTGADTVQEVITLSCTSASAGAGTFSVNGSVSGSLGNATAGVAFSTSVVSFTITVGGTDYIVGDNFIITVTKQAPAASPYYALPWTLSTGVDWIWTSLTAAYRWDGNTHDDITRASGGAYTATTELQWTGCVSGDVVYLNNGEDLPQYIGTSGSNLANFPTGGSNWPSNLRCKSLRSFKSYLIAMNLTEGASLRPQSVRWSTASDPGSLPYWDITDPTLEAGENVLAETDGVVVDGLSLGDSFIIYKSDSVTGMQLVGGQFVMSFYKIFTDDGIMSQNCVTNIPGQHFVASDTDVYVHNGSTKQSIISGKARDILFSIIDRSYKHRSYCVTDMKNKEALFCFVLAGSGATLPNLAMVYNWDNGSVSIRSLPGASYIATGSISSYGTTPQTWATDVNTWESDVSLWSDNGQSVSAQRLVILDTANNKFYADGDYTTDAGTYIQNFCQRTGIDAGDPDKIKFVSRIIPRLTGTGSVDVDVCTQDVRGGTETWTAAGRYTIGTSRKIDCRASGRYIGVRFTGVNDAAWQLSSYTLEGTGLGDGKSA